MIWDHKSVFGFSPKNALVTASVSHFVTAATKFSCCSSNKKNVSFVFYLWLWISVALFLVELRWPATYFLCFSVPLLDMTINLSLYFRQHGYRNNFRFPFSCLLTLQLPLLYKTPVAMRCPSKITSSCIWVAIPVHWVILHWYACGADGRSGGRTVTWLPNFLG